MMSALNEPHAEQIIEVNDEHKIILKLDVLREILMQDDIRDKPVCVISITGPCRQGKSFLLNFLLRYLNIRYKDKKKVEHWLEPNEGQVSGFPWKAGSTRHTFGILIWSEIFLAKLATDEEMAIVLLDTQGSFDNNTEVSECTTILALATLISSLQIYNLKEGLKQYDLSYLKCFSDYGQCIFDKKNNCSFQNLLVLIRDWPYPHEYKFGAEGGREFLNCELGSNELQSSDLIALKDDVKNLFESISCFLLPHPGRSITAATALEGIDNEFKKYVELLGSTILAPENLIAKKVNGEKVKVGDLFNLIKTYYEQLQSKEIPALPSMSQATAEVHHKDTIEESIALYENLMAFIKMRESKSLGKNLVYKKHCESKSTAIAYFRTKRKMGDKATNDKYDLVLQQKLEHKLLEYEKYDEMKRKYEERVKVEEELRRETQLMDQQCLKLEQEVEKKRQELLQEQRLREEEQRIHEQKIQEEKRRQRELQRQQYMQEHRDSQFVSLNSRLQRRQPQKHQPDREYDVVELGEKRIQNEKEREKGNRPVYRPYWNVVARYSPFILDMLFKGAVIFLLFKAITENKK